MVSIASLIRLLPNLKYLVLQCNKLYQQAPLPLFCKAYLRMVKVRFQIWLVFEKLNLFREFKYRDTTVHLYS